MSINDIITVPVTIHDSGKARIVGIEWGPDNGRKRSEGWAYYLSFGYGPAWLATEEQVREWNRQTTTA